MTTHIYNGRALTVAGLAHYLTNTYGPDARVLSFSVDIDPKDAFEAAKRAEAEEPKPREVYGE